MASTTPKWTGPYEVVHRRNEGVKLRCVGNESDKVETNLKSIKLYNRSAYMCILAHLGSIRDPDDASCRNRNKIRKYLEWWTDSGFIESEIKLRKGKNDST